MKTGGAVIATLVVCALAGVARADNKEAAKQAYTEGKRQYDLGEYGAALDDFKKAYLNYEEPVFLFNIAQCYRALGDRPAAVRTYRAFLRNWPKAPNREQVERIVSELEVAIAQDATAKATPPPDTLTPKSNDSKPREAAAPAATAPAATPPPATPAGTPAATNGSAAQASATPSPAAAPPPATTSEPSAKKPPPRDDGAGMVEIEPNFERPSGSGKSLKWWGWTLIAVSVAGVAAAAVAIGITQQDSGPKFGSTLPDFNAQSASLRTLQVRF